METTTTTPEVKPQPEMTPAQGSMIDNLREFSRTPKADFQQTYPEPEPGKTVVTDSEFLSTGKHTNEPLLGASGNEFSNKTPVNPPQSTQAGNIRPIGQLVPNAGKFAVSLLDMFLPACIIFFARQAGYVTKKEGLKLNKEERETLAPAFENFLNSINVNFDKPVYQLLIVLGLVYGSKFMEGNITFDKVGKYKRQEPAPTDIKVTEENYKDVFDLEREKLIVSEAGKRRKSKESTTKVLLENGAFKRLDKELRLKHGLKMSA